MNPHQILFVLYYPSFYVTSSSRGKRLGYVRQIWPLIVDPNDGSVTCLHMQKVLKKMWLYGFDRMTLCTLDRNVNSSAAFCFVAWTAQGLFSRKTAQWKSRFCRFHPEHFPRHTGRSKLLDTACACACRTRSFSRTVRHLPLLTTYVFLQLDY